MKILNSQNNLELVLESIDTSLSILHTLWSNSLYNNKALCSGVGKCGKCKILFHSQAPKTSSDEEKILTKQEIDRGIRLACKHNANHNYIIELLDNFPYSNKEEISKILDYSHNFKMSDDFNSLHKKKISTCLALDFGTTTIEYELFNNEKVYAHGKQLNPMQGVGSEVMARLEFARNKEQAILLKEKSVETLKNIIEKANELGFEVEKIIFSANSAMTYLALGIESSCLATSPYLLEFKGDCLIELQGLPPLYIPPLLAPFVGGDISSGLLALKNEKSLEFPYLFIDMGTNAEFVLALNEKEALIASVPLGPSIEGIGLTFGSLAYPSSIVDFQITPLGIISQTLDENIKEASGICGVAYLNLLSALKKISLLDKSGHFSVQDTIPLGRKVAKIFQNKGEDCLKINDKFYLSSSDIERILMVKSAFRTAYEILLKQACDLKYASFEEQKLKKIYIAGTFGKYSKVEALVELGFLPHIPQANIEQVGNMSLQGAKLLCSQVQQEKIKENFQNFKHVELANHKDFANNYMKHFSLAD